MTSPGSQVRARRRSSAAIWLLVVAFMAEIALFMFWKLDAATIALIHVLAFSVLTLLAFIWDKWKAMRGTARVSEATLLSISVLGGALGGLAAMLAVRHKTQRAVFWIVLCSALFVHVTLVGWLFISR